MPETGVLPFTDQMWAYFLIFAPSLIVAGYGDAYLEFLA